MSPAKVKSRTCPICGAPAVQDQTAGNGGWLYVAEDMETSTECYDGDIAAYICSGAVKHTFYCDPAA